MVIKPEPVWRRRSGGPAMSGAPPNYRAFLVRLWQDSTVASGSAGWRASLDDPRTGQRLGFASLEQLFDYLMGLTEAGGRRGETPQSPDPDAAA